MFANIYWSASRPVKGAWQVEGSENSHVYTTAPKRHVVLRLNSVTPIVQDSHKQTVDDFAHKMIHELKKNYDKNAKMNINYSFCFLGYCKILTDSFSSF